MSDPDFEEEEDDEEDDEGEDLREPTIDAAPAPRGSRGKVKEPAYHSPQQFARLIGAVGDATAATTAEKKQAGKALHRNYDRIEKLQDRIGDLREEIARLKSEKEEQKVAEAKANAEVEQTKARVAMALQGLKTVGDLGGQFIELQKLSKSGEGSGAVFAQEFYSSLARLFGALQAKAPEVYQAISKACPVEFTRIELVGQAYAQSRPAASSPKPAADP